MSFYIDALSKLPDGTTTARHVSDYYNYPEALAAAKHLIDSFLLREYRNAAAKGIGASLLLEIYKARGEKPVILRKGGNSSTNIARFNAISYATQRCMEICEGASKN